MLVMHQGLHVSGVHSLTFSCMCRLPGSTSSLQGPGLSQMQAPQETIHEGQAELWQPPDPDQLFQPRFMTTATSISVEGPA